MIGGRCERSRKLVWVWALALVAVTLFAARLLFWVVRILPRRR